MIVELAGKPIGGIVATDDGVARHPALAVIGSRGLLENSVNVGNAGQALNAGKNSRVRVRLS